MFVTLKSAARALGAAGTGLALAGALPAIAAEATPAAAPVSATSSQIVVRDAVSGQLRAATPEEAKALTSKQAGRDAATARTMPKTHPSGAQGARLTDEFMTYSVATRRADGSVAVEHAQSRSAAEATVQAAKVAPARAVTE